MAASVNHRYNSSSAGMLPAVDAAWPDMPEEFIHHVISFNPESALTLSVVSRWFKQAGDSFLELNQRNIFAKCPRGSLPLYRWIHGGSLPGGSARAFHLSLPGEIRSLGVSGKACPNSILSFEEVDRCNASIMDASLEGAWGPIARRAIQDNPPATCFPKMQATAQEIRPWMDQNLPKLQNITRVDFSGQGLTSVPLEIGLLGNLRELCLNNNRLRAIPPGVFHGMPQLQVLQMNDNHLSVLPSDLFNGLGSLQHLLLQNNRLGALPAVIFHGLGALQHLFLNSNLLTALPLSLFDGVTQLQRLSLADNQLRLLPPDLCHGLDDLGILFLHGNPQLLVTLQEMPPHRNAIGFLKTVDQFFNYQCQSPLAAFYQLVASSTSTPADVERAFFGLPATHKSALLGMISDLDGSDAQQCGEKHLFEDMRMFHRVMKKMVGDQFERLADNQKQHAGEHILKFIDAMQMQKVMR